MAELLPTLEAWAAALEGEFDERDFSVAHCKLGWSVHLTDYRHTVDGGYYPLDDAVREALAAWAGRP